MQYPPYQGFGQGIPKGYNSAGEVDAESMPILSGLLVLREVERFVPNVVEGPNCRRAPSLLQEKHMKGVLIQFHGIST